jgi:hypothetical protein
LSPYAGRNFSKFLEKILGSNHSDVRGPFLHKRKRSAERPNGA